MLVVFVDIWVKAECVTSFVEATKQNAAASRLEPGIARFDFLVDEREPTHFQLVEAYRNPDAPAAHKETAHYKLWRDTVESMMAKPRSSLKTQSLSPGDSEW